MISDDHGQAILVMALGMVVLVAIAGLAIDSSNLYLTRRQAQNATDFAALAAGKQLAAATFTLAAPPASGDPSVMAAHDFASLNGFPTVYSTSCDAATSSTFAATWFDAAGPSCGATAGFKTKVQVNVPAVAANGLPVPDTCTGAARFSCFQVTVTQRVDTFFERTFGIVNTYFTVSAVVLTTPAIQGYTLPPPVAVYLYQPQSGCQQGQQQCFDESQAASRTLLSCAGSSNCPTFWVVNGTAPSFNGTDGGSSIPVAGDMPTLQSNGDMVIQDKTVFCDPYNGATCSGSNAVGTKGFALASGSKLYCSGFTAGGTRNGLIDCTTTGQSGLKQVAGKETTFTSLGSWNPSIDTSALPDCGALILNGKPVSNSFTMSAAAECSSATEPYVIMPGRYRYIVVNHGTYEFESGLYDLTSTAPVNTQTGGSYFANGIDHKNERNADDWDLCNGGQSNSCQSLTSAVWIGHGGGSYGAYDDGQSGSGTCAVGGGGTTGGGGDGTTISGSGVTFRFESTAGGFVSTNEVRGISLSAPGVGALTSVGGAPILFDLENNSFIHLDGPSSGEDHQNSVSQFSGLIFQKRTATGGGVELNPGLTSDKKTAAVAGQIFAYSLTTFGSSGAAVDFTDDYGGMSQPTVGTSGKAEMSLVSSSALTQAVDATGTVIPGYETLTVNYTDEWALDAYAVYLKVNNAQPVFFSQGIWNPVPAGGSSLPPAGNTPGDNHPARAGAPPAGYTVKTDPITGQQTDWTITVGSGATAATFEVYGNWTWGHERDIAGATTKNNKAILKYTFPTPAGTAVNITIFLTDGDRCGDYYLVNATFNNQGQPGAGAQSGGSVVVVR